MNCKPNDLAIIVKAEEFPNLLGKIVKLASTTVTTELGVQWLLVDTVLGICPRGCCGYELLAYPDAYLKPVSGLSDDESIDETIKETA